MELAQALSPALTMPLDAVTVTPETGLVTLSFWGAGGGVHLVLGLGPRVVGAGVHRRTPRYVASKQHPLVAFLRARVLSLPLRAVTEGDDGALWIDLGALRVEARIGVLIGRRGSLTVFDDAGVALTRWQSEDPRTHRHLDPTGSPDAVGAALVEASDALVLETRRGVLIRVLGQEIKKLARRREAVEGDLERLDDVARLQRIGRMLLAQGAGVARGAREATLEDWETGGTLTVALDPALPAKRQAEGFFKKAKRIAQAEAVMWARLEETDAKLQAVRALEAEIKAPDAVSLGQLSAWSEAARKLGVRVESLSAPAGAKTQKTRLPYIEYLFEGGHRVLVGRGARDNDQLTGRIARPHDLWLHARGVHGAHVIVVIEKGRQVDPGLLVDAATLAAHHSDARGEGVVDIQWTERRYVRKPRKSAPGAVVLDRERVLALRVEPERLARALKARVEA